MAGLRLSSSRWLAAALLLGAVVAARAAPDGAALYAHYCIPCHGPDGRAHSPAARKLKAKDLAGSRLPDADIAHQIANGKKDAAGKQRMPAFKPELTDAEIAALVGFVKGLRK